jgi:hypothetical protein
MEKREHQLVSRHRNSLEFERASGPLASLLLAQIRPVLSVVAPRARAGFALSVLQPISVTGH